MVALSLAKITLDPQCQPRVRLEDAVVDEYTQAMTEGADFPPLTVYRDGSTYWLADGFHRYRAAENAGIDPIECDVREGDLRAATLHAVGANAHHGQRRNNRDKWRSVKILLADDVWSKWSDRDIAQRCGVTHPFVGTVRQSLSGNRYQIDEIRLATRNGATYELNTANIGRSHVALIDDVNQETGEIVVERSPITHTSIGERARMVAVGLVRANGNTFARSVANAILEMTGS